MNNFAGFVQLWEDAAQNIYALVYDKDGNLLNIVDKLESAQPLYYKVFIESCRQGLPNAPQWYAGNHDGKEMAQLEAELQAQKHQLATIWANQSPTPLYPELADEFARQFLIRWFFN